MALYKLYYLLTHLIDLEWQFIIIIIIVNMTQEYDVLAQDIMKWSYLDSVCARQST